MGILVRSAIVIGALVYLAPLRYDQPTTDQPLHQPDNLSVSGAADAVWKSLPDNAKKTVSDEVQKQLIEAAKKEALSRIPFANNTERASQSPKNFPISGNPEKN
ncbi:hypothetical protein WJT86_05000 [Microvirga sp. W0021]|uniref:Uncharacterized protein n=1 Tax=Hohaiivirga grylli TaxID=3133970 RepID=A0ABV0BJH2_9HYPH